MIAEYELESQLQERDEWSKAEEFVVSIGMTRPDVVPRMAAIVGRNHFLDTVMGQMWQLITDLSLSGDLSNTGSVVTECSKRGIIEKLGGAAVLARIVNVAPNHAHAIYYSEEVVRYAEIRRIRMAADSAILELERDTAEPAKVLAAFEAAVQGLGGNADAGFQSIAELADRELENNDPNRKSLSEDWKPFSSGFACLDSYIGGLSPGKLYLIGGRTGIGKSAFAANIAIKAAMDGRKVWFSSMEMTSAEIAQRIISDQCEIDLHKWKHGLSAHEWKLVSDFKKELAEFDLWLTDKSESFSSIKAKARMRQALDGLDLIIIDNLQLVKPMDYKLPRHQQLKGLTEVFKNVLAKELGVAVVILCQLTADAEPGKEQKTLDNTAWADSKRIIDDADVAMMIHRASRSSNDASLLITKNRGGIVGTVPMKWDGSLQRFSDASIEQINGYQNVSS